MDPTETSTRLIETHKEGRRLRRRKREYERTDLTGILGFSPSPTPNPHPNIVVGFFRFLIGAAIIGVLVGLIATPFVLPPAIGARTAALWWQNLPHDDLPVNEALPQRSVMYAADGKTRIASFYAENRVPLTAEQIPDNVKNALISTEDIRFYSHNGFDIRGLGRAFINNNNGGDRQGGSTITQQYVKNILLTNASTEEEKAAVTAVTLDRKIRELRYAVALEQQLTKEQILTGYLNTVYFGNGAYGIGAAARRYFSVNATDLTLPQAALLIGLLKSPTNYNPLDRDKRMQARERRNTVLDRMYTNHKISQLEYEQASLSPLRLKVSTPANGCDASPYPFYCQWVREILANDPTFGATEEARQDFLYKGGLKIVTAMDPAAMKIAQTAVNRALTPTNRATTGIAVVQPGTGNVVAIATSKRWGLHKSKGQTQIIVPVVPAFQPGSNFKPVVLATALEQGFPIATRFNTPNNYKPATLNHPPDGFSNDDDSGHGIIDAYKATAMSVNTWFVQLIERTGVLPVADMAARLGITSIPRDGTRRITSKDAATALGVWETSPVQMASAYATFAAQGVNCRPTAILSITRVDGESIPVPNPNCRQAINAGVANTVTDVLQAPFGDGGTAATLRLDNDRPAAGKTGTTNNHGATWFSGYTPQYAASVWVGDMRGPTYGLYGVRAYGTYYGTVYGMSIAGPIWKETMNRLLKGQPIIPFPGADPAAAAGTGVSVPDVRGLPRDTAISVLIDAGYRPRLVTKTAKPDPLLPAGYVAVQSPAPGTEFGPETVVKLMLTDGSDLNVTVPDPGSPAPVANALNGQRPIDYTALIPRPSPTPTPSTGSGN